MGLFRRLLDQKNQYKKLFSLVQKEVRFDLKNRDLCRVVKYEGTEDTISCPFYNLSPKSCVLFSRWLKGLNRDKECIEIFGENENV